MVETRDAVSRHRQPFLSSGLVLGEMGVQPAVRAPGGGAESSAIGGDWANGDVETPLSSSPTPPSGRSTEVSCLCHDT